MNDKNEIRQKILADRLALSPENIHAYSAGIQEKLMKSAFWPKQGRIGLYAPVKNEVLTQDLFRRALEQGLHVYFPRVEQGIRFYEVNGPEDLQRGSWSIPEPKTNCPVLAEEDDEKLDLLIVPGVAFTKDGYRIGYGKGFYDRFITGHPGRSVALAYEIQLIDHFPIDSWDQPLTSILTEKNNYPVQRKV